MLDATKLIDVYVCNPEAGIATSLKSVFLQFEKLDSDTMARTGTTIGLGLTAEDAMWLLKHLQHLQARFDLPVPDGAIVDATPGKMN
jgi:hypothetical protein